MSAKCPVCDSYGHRVENCPDICSEHGQYEPCPMHERSQDDDTRTPERAQEG